MREHAGPACALSGLIVGLFAILLHDKVPAPPVAISRAPDVAKSKPRVVSPPSDATGAIPRPKVPVVFAPTPPVEEGREVAPIAVPARVSEGARVAPPEPHRPPPTEALPGPAMTKTQVAPLRPPVPPSPRPPFAVVGLGESLADVAVRVYGSREAAEALWKANRDQVERIDSSLARGTLLRTP